MPVISIDTDANTAAFGAEATSEAVPMECEFAPTAVPWHESEVTSRLSVSH